tara:strand:+ start:549 stop:1970 length:1422 start_codon:yes stop_codon:yes gene_type:complete
MGDIIDTKNKTMYLILIIAILVLIIKTDTEVIIAHSEVVTSCTGTATDEGTTPDCTAAFASSGTCAPGCDTRSSLGDWIRQIINIYWPTVLSILSIILFILFSGEGSGSYISFFILIFIGIFFTSYTIYQWESGQRPTPAGASTFKPTDEKCSGILPVSDHFQTKEYQFFRFFYYLTLIIVASCAANNMNENKSIIILLPLIIPTVMEIISAMLNYVEKEANSATISPELLLINFIRGGHTGGGAIPAESPAAGEGADGSPKPGIDYSLWRATDWLEGTNPFFNSHFMFSMIFYIALMITVVYYSQGLGGNPVSNTPIYIALIIMMGFPFFMKYIFIQEESINELKDNLPDGIKNVRRDFAYSPGGTNPEVMSAYVKACSPKACDGTPSQSDVRAEATEPRTLNEGEDRLKEKGKFACRIEKYGGIQMVLCSSLIIMIISNTHQKRDKFLAFLLIILFTYGLSQTLIASNVYT